MAQCVMVNGERTANGCKSCANIQVTRRHRHASYVISRSSCSGMWLVSLVQHVCALRLASRRRPQRPPRAPGTPRPLCLFLLNITPGTLHSPPSSLHSTPPPSLHSPPPSRLCATGLSSLDPQTSARLPRLQRRRCRPCPRATPRQHVSNLFASSALPCCCKCRMQTVFVCISTNGISQFASELRASLIQLSFRLCCRKVGLGLFQPPAPSKEHMMGCLSGMAEGTGLMFRMHQTRAFGNDTWAAARKRKRATCRTRSNLIAGMKEVWAWLGTVASRPPCRQLFRAVSFACLKADAMRDADK